MDVLEVRKDLERQKKRDEKANKDEPLWRLLVKMTKDAAPAHRQRRAHLERVIERGGGSRELAFGAVKWLSSVQQERQLQQIERQAEPPPAAAAGGASDGAVDFLLHDMKHSTVDMAHDLEPTEPAGGAERRGGASGPLALYEARAEEVGAIGPRTLHRSQCMVRCVPCSVCTRLTRRHRARGGRSAPSAI